MTVDRVIDRDSSRTIRPVLRVRGRRDLLRKSQKYLNLLVLSNITVRAALRYF